MNAPKEINGENKWKIQAFKIALQSKSKSMF